MACCTLLKWLQKRGSGSKTSAQTKQLVGARHDRAAGEPAQACHNARAQKPENGMDGTTARLGLRQNVPESAN